MSQDLNPVPPTYEGWDDISEGVGFALDFDSDEPLVCNRDQSSDTTCQSCQ